MTLTWNPNLHPTLILTTVSVMAQVMLARAPHVAYTTFLCVFGALGLIPMALLRVRLGPAALVINLGFVFAMINAQFFWGIDVLWVHVRPLC